MRTALLLALAATAVNAAEDEDWMRLVPEDVRELLTGESEGSAYMGPTRLDAASFDTLTVTGPASINNVTVEGEANIMGPLHASNGSHIGVLVAKGPCSLENSSIDTGEVQGSLDMTSSQMSGDLTMHGPLYATDSQLQNIQITTSELMLENSRCENITVMKSGIAGEVAEIHLKGSTVVNGRIRFEDGVGKVIVYGQNVAIGEVVGGTVEREG